MVSEQSKTKVGRPSDTGSARNRQFSFSVSDDERSVVIDAVKVSGKSLTTFLRDAALMAARGGLNISSQCVESTTGRHVKSTTGQLKSTTENVEVVEEKRQQFLPPTAVPQTRADAHPSARTQKVREEKRDLESSSLRSSQAAPVASQSEADDSPWAKPPLLKQTIKLSTGEVVTNMWLFANSCRMPGSDVTRILETAMFKPLRKSMLQCFARSLRDTYRMRWCAAYNRKMNAWRDTPRSNNAFLRAAELLAREYASRDMTTTQFIDACDEMRPKSLKFVAVDMVGGAIGARVADWIPPEQRDRDKPWTSHVDQTGTQWITPQGEGDAVPVLRSAADRERFLKAHKVRG